MKCALFFSGIQLLRSTCETLKEEVAHQYVDVHRDTPFK